MSKFDDPDSLDSYTLTFLEINGVPFTQLSQPVELSKSDKARISIEPIDPGRGPLSKTEELIVTMAELRGIEEQCKENRLSLVTELSGEPGTGAGKVELSRRFVEKILRDRVIRNP
jgi:hypothetical protein